MRDWLKRLPPEKRYVGEQVRELFLEHGFQNYEQLTDAIHALFEKEGIELRPSVPSVHRVGKKFEEELEGLRLLREQAKIAATELGDDGAEISDFVVRTVMLKGYHALQQLDITSGEVSPKEFAMFGRMLAELGKSSVQIKRLRQTYHERIERAADEVAQKLKAAGAGLAERLDSVLAKHLSRHTEQERQKITAEVLDAVRSDDGTFHVLTDDYAQQIRQKILYGVIDDSD